MFLWYCFALFNIMWFINDHLIRRPLLARGTKAAWLGIVRFSTIMGHAFSYKAMLLSVLRAQIGGGSALPDPELRIRYITKNPSIYKFVFKAQETRKAAPKASKNRHKSIPKFITNNFRGKSFFAKPSLRKPRFGSTKRRNFDSDIDNEMTWNQTQKNEISSFL